MKTKFSFAILFVLFNFHFGNSQTLREIINILADSQNKTTSEVKKASLLEITNKTLSVNSSSNAYFSGGKTRDVIKIELPKGTINWYYRVTVLDIKSNYSYSYNETLAYLLSNKKTMDTYSPTSFGIDFYLLGHTGDVNSFLETGNNNFRSYPTFTKTNTNSFVNYSNFINENLWIGIKNPNASQGLKVIVEVVTYGYYN